MPAPPEAERSAPDPGPDPEAAKKVLEEFVPPGGDGAAAGDRQPEGPPEPEASFGQVLGMLEFLLAAWLGLLARMFRIPLNHPAFIEFRTLAPHEKAMLGACSDGLKDLFATASASLNTPRGAMLVLLMILAGKASHLRRVAQDLRGPKREWRDRDDEIEDGGPPDADAAQPE